MKDRLIAAATWVALVFGVALVVYILRGDLVERVPTPRPFLDHLLAIVAIAFGIVAIVYERKLHHGFENQKKEINDIVLAVHTRHLGDWPDHLRDITSLVSRAGANDELWILVDHIGYGHYSRPDDFEKYIDSLESARNRGVAVRLLTYAEKQANEGARRQFTEATFALDSPEVQAYFSRYGHIIPGRPTNYDQFIDFALELENHFCRQLLLERLSVKRPIEIRTLGGAADQDAFFWMWRRGKTAIEVVFAYPKFGSGQKGHAFISRDPNLMDEFAARFDGKWTSGLPAEDPLYRLAYYAVGTFAPRSSRATT